MFSFVVISDVHYDDYLSFCQEKDSEGRTKRLIRYSEALSQVLDYCLQNNVNTVFCIGDLIERKSNISSEVLHWLKKDLFNFEANQIHFYNISGNHDFLDRACTKSVLDIFETSFFHSITEKKILEIQENVCIHCSPDTLTQKEDLSWLQKSTGMGKIHILLAHIGVNGAWLNSHKKCDDAFELKDLYPDYFNAILLGDFHKHQKLGTNTPAYYVGALLQKNFGEEGNPQHFLHVFGKGEAMALKWISLKGMPEFLTLSPDQTLPKDFNGYVRIKGDKPVSQKQLKSLYEKIGKQAEQFFIEVPVETQDKIRLDFSDCGTFLDQVNKYITNKAPEKGLDVDYLKQLARHYYVGN